MRARRTNRSQRNFLSVPVSRFLVPDGPGERPALTIAQNAPIATLEATRQSVGSRDPSRWHMPSQLMECKLVAPCPQHLFQRDLGLQRLPRAAAQRGTQREG